jgi:hypothetical protein
MIREWRNFTSERKALETFIKWGIFAIGGLCGIPALLVALSALGIVHLR